MVGLLLPEEEQSSETVKFHTCLYDKKAKGYKEKDAVANAWANVAEQLEFVQNGEKALSLFTVLKKKYLRKKKEWRNVNRSGTERTPMFVEGEKGIKEYSFMNWIDSFVQPRNGRTNIGKNKANDPPEKGTHEDTQENTQEESQDVDGDNEGSEAGSDDDSLFGEDEEEIESDKESIVYPKPDDSNTGTNKTTSKATSSTSTKDNKKKSKKVAQGATNEVFIEEMELSVMSKMNRKLNEKEKRKREKENIKQGVDSEDAFCKALSLELKQLPMLVRCIAKQDIRSTLFKHQMAVMSHQMQSNHQYNQSPNPLQQLNQTPSSINPQPFPMPPTNNDMQPINLHQMQPIPRTPSSTSPSQGDLPPQLLACIIFPPQLIPLFGTHGFRNIQTTKDE